MFATLGGAIVGAAAGYVKQPQGNEKEPTVDYGELELGEDPWGILEPIETEEVEVARASSKGESKGKSKGKSKGRSKDKVVALAGAEEVAEKSKEKAGPLADDEDDFELTGDEHEEFEEKEGVAEGFFDEEEPEIDEEYEISEPEELDFGDVPPDYEGEDPGFDGAPEAPDFGTEDADWFNDDSEDESSDNKVEEGVDKDAKK